MSQTSVIAGGLLVAFIVFITIRGELPGYFGVLGIGTAAVSGSTASTGSSTGSSTNGGGTVVNPPITQPTFPPNAPIQVPVVK